MNLRIGVHTSISGGIYKSVERAVSLECTTMQIFSHNPRQWKKTQITPEERDLFKRLIKAHDIDPVFIHACYLINLASISEDVIMKSIDMLAYELHLADVLRIPHVIVHTGSAPTDDPDEAIKKTINSIKSTVRQGKFKSRIILENTAGRKGNIGSTISSLARIIDGCHGEGISGICIDTCHAFASGYDISTPSGAEALIREVDEYIGLERLILIHVNDSRGACGSGIDRHEHIGKGKIRIKGFRNFLLHDALRGIPLILETPKTSDEDDRRNITLIKKLFTS